ncbi:MAG: response regulator [Desulfobulbaceae bacterium]|nr:response regulator [Desulfobulbaceae bacterium]
MMNKKILVVDNSPVILRLMENFLSREGHYVLCAVDGLEALEILQKFRPDVIFVDLVMPKIPGEKLCRVIKTMPELAKAYVIVLSAVAVEQELDFASFGAHACIAKGPFKEVEKHILALFASLDRGEADQVSKDVIGTENVFKRIVTEELLSVKKHFDATLVHMHEGFLELTPAGQIVSLNPAAARLLGETEEKVLSRHLCEFFDVTHVGLLKDCCAQLDGRPVSLGEEQPFMLNGRYILMTLFCLAEYEQNSIIVIFQDIDDRKRAEQELKSHRDHLEYLVEQRTSEIISQHQSLVKEVQRRQKIEVEKQKLEASLRQTHKMEALGTLAAGIAHDFNNILTAVIGFTELCQLEVHDRQPLYDNLEQVKKAGRRARDLIKNILTFSRKKEQEFHPTHVQIALREVLKLLKASVQSNIHIREDIDVECGPILADTTQLHQIILNLCTNAFYAMRGKGGVLTVRLEEVERPRLGSEGDSVPLVKFVKLTITDTGVGIEPALLEKIFDPYFSTKEPGEGTGMGLAVVHGIVSSHGGQITVERVPGEGSSFAVFFPELPSGEGQKNLVEHRLMKGSESILVVDDDAAILDATTQILQALGYQVHAVGNSKEALQVFEACNGEFDLVITDQEMPGINGTELAAQLIVLRPDVSIILCTGYGQYLSEEQIQAFGIKHLLLKPFYFPELASAVRKVLDG